MLAYMLVYVLMFYDVSFDVLLWYLFVEGRETAKECGGGRQCACRFWPVFIGPSVANAERFVRLSRFLFLVSLLPPK